MNDKKIVFVGKITKHGSQKVINVPAALFEMAKEFNENDVRITIETLKEKEICNR